MPLPKWFSAVWLLRDPTNPITIAELANLLELSVGAARKLKDRVQQLIDNGDSIVRSVLAIRQTPELTGPSIQNQRNIQMTETLELNKPITDLLSTLPTSYALRLDWLMRRERMKSRLSVLETQTHLAARGKSEPLTDEEELELNALPKRLAEFERNEARIDELNDAIAILMGGTEKQPTRTTLGTVALIDEEGHSLAHRVVTVDHRGPIPAEQREDMFLRAIEAALHNEPMLSDAKYLDRCLFDEGTDWSDMVIRDDAQEWRD